jgi:hypothetical protein
MIPVDHFRREKMVSLKAERDRTWRRNDKEIRSFSCLKKLSTPVHVRIMNVSIFLSHYGLYIKAHSSGLSKSNAYT